MAITEETIDVKTEIFWAQGRPAGAHHIRAVVVKRDGVEMSRSELPALNLTMAELAASGIINDAFATAVDRAAELEKENAALKAQVMPR